ncbi:glycosyltransferase [Solwaraspora sp. WMMB335]|uniref:glycosyltransferase n=1 Tax=Solwaraspora sp. WMMB335 TaxID=3404118 RepID=UPI003B94AC76
MASTVTAAAVRIPRQRTTPRPATVLVAVGTDRHRFDRLIDWLEDWHTGARGRADMIIQYGHSRTPDLDGASAFLDHDTMQRAMAGASLVVCHGGPATILEARRHRHLPIVVPRDPAHREHVDDHQLLFARRLAAAGLVHLCESRAELAAALDTGLRDPDGFVTAGRAGTAASALAASPLEAVARVGRIVEELIASANPRRLSIRRQR